MADEDDARSSDDSASSTTNSSSSSSSSSNSRAIHDYVNETTTSSSDVDDDEHASRSPTMSADDEKDERIPPPAAAAPARHMLSKHWKLAKSHVPLYTGGRVRPVAAAAASFLLLPVHGNVVLWDLHTSAVACSVRPQSDDNMEQEPDDLDMDAITAVAGHENMVLTVSRNQLLRQYHITGTNTIPMVAADDATGTNTKTSIVLTKVWGKSGHVLPTPHLEWHVGGLYVATGSVDGTVRVWDRPGAHVTHVYRPYTTHHHNVIMTPAAGVGAVTCLSWAEPSSLLLSSVSSSIWLAIGRDNGSIAVHDLQQPQQQQQQQQRHVGAPKMTAAAALPMALLTDHDAAVTCIVWTNNNSVMVTAGRDMVLNVWHVVVVEVDDATDARLRRQRRNNNKSRTTMQWIKQQTLPVYEQVEGVVLLPSPSGLMLATAGSRGQVRLWGTTANSSQQLQLLTEQGEAHAFGEPRGGYTQLLLHDASLDNNNHTDLQLLVTDAEHNLTFLSLFGLGQAPLTVLRTIVGHNDDILDLRVIPGCQQIVVATNSPQLKLFDLDTFSCTVWDGHTATVLCVDASACGRYVTSCGKDKTVRVWRVDHGECVAMGASHTEAVGAVAMSRKPGRYDISGGGSSAAAGAFIVSASVDRTLKRWNLPGATALDGLGTNDAPLALAATTSVRAHEKDINCVTIAPNDSLLATGSQDKTVKIWQAVDLALKATLTGHRRGVWDCQFSPVDKVLASGSGDQTIKLWSLSDYTCVRTFQGHVASVLRVRFLSGGLQLLSSGADGLLKLWTIRTNECEATMDQHQGKVWALDMLPDGKSAVSAGADSRLLVWQDETVQMEDAKHKEAAEVIELDQLLANHLRHKNYSDALQIALAREKPMHVLRVFTSIVSDDFERRDPLLQLQQYARTWNESRCLQVLRYCREWNTRAKTSLVALLLVKAIVTTKPAHELAAMPGVPEVLAAIVPYAERHFDRLERLVTNSYLIDFTVSCMGTLAADENAFDRWQDRSKMMMPPVPSMHSESLVEEHQDEDVVTIGSTSNSSSSDDEDR